MCLRQDLRHDVVEVRLLRVARQTHSPACRWCWENSGRGLPLWDLTAQGASAG